MPLNIGADCGFKNNDNKNEINDNYKFCKNKYLILIISGTVYTELKSVTIELCVISHLSSQVLSDVSVNSNFVNKRLYVTRDKA